MANDTAINEALQTLLDGNKRFAAMEQTHPNQDRTRRDEVKAGQKPFAVIVGCSDSRIPPEILFDQGDACLFLHLADGCLGGGLSGFELTADAGVFLQPETPLLKAEQHFSIF